MGERKNFKPVPNDYRKEQTYAFYPSYEPVVRDRKGGVYYSIAYTISFM